PDPGELSVLPDAGEQPEALVPTQVGVPDAPPELPPGDPSAEPEPSSLAPPADPPAVLGDAAQSAGDAFQDATGLPLPGSPPGPEGGPQATAPAAPTNLRVTAGNAQASLAWSTPASDGGSAITGYDVYRSEAGGSEALVKALGAVRAFTDTALTNGHAYAYRVSAANAAGEGAKSAAVSATPSVGSNQNNNGGNGGGGNGGGSNGAGSGSRSTGTDPFAGSGAHGNGSAAGASVGVGSVRGPPGGTSASPSSEVVADSSEGGSLATAAGTSLGFAPEVPVLLYVGGLAILVLGGRYVMVQRGRADGDAEVAADEK
ncbi:MAG: fibronectin type III domain-containing protein, partial [Halobacteriales archaeon]|nr:fibronectin type III domain-containing protein [Halobacteriales archaeon]